LVNAVLPVTIVTLEKVPGRMSLSGVCCLDDNGCDIAAAWNSIPTKQEIIRQKGNRKFMI
jgi:hypothetical protein